MPHLVHVCSEVAPTLALYVPAGQLVHDAASPLVPYVPLGQRVHLRGDVALAEASYEPGAQGSGAGACGACGACVLGVRVVMVASSVSFDVKG